MEKREPSFSVGVNVHLFSHNGKQLKMKNRTLNHPTISLLGIYPKDMKMGYWRVLCTPIFIIALFTKTKIWKPQKCLSKGELIKKMWYYIYKEYYSTMIKKYILPFATTWMDLEDIMLIEMSY